MSFIPRKYKTRRERESYSAGYKAGYSNQENKSELRFDKDLKKIYNYGFEKGQEDKSRKF